MVRRESISTFLNQFISFFIYRYPTMPSTLTQVTLLDPLSFSTACVLFYIRAHSVVVFASVLLSEQMWILLIVMFSDKRSSHNSGLPQFSFKRCREAIRKTALPVVVPWSINTCTKAVVKSWPVRVPNGNVTVGDFTFTHINTLRTGLLNCLNARSQGLTFRHRASCI